MLELKNKCDSIERREQESRKLEEKKHNEEIQALKKTNSQLQVHIPLLLLLLLHSSIPCSLCPQAQLEGLIAPTKK